MKKYSSLFKILIGGILTLFSCTKGSDSSVPTPNPTPPNPTPKNCIISYISQQNSGPKPEFALTIAYNSSLSPIQITAFDSATNKQLFFAKFTYASSDSIRIDSYQYIKLDANKRVVSFFTKSDMTDVQNSDNYHYEYKYNAEGFLVTKNLFINASLSPTYVTTYSYTNGLLMGCLMIAASAGNKKVLESTISYEASLSPKTMIYTFPDGFESYYYSCAFNFGLKPNKPLKQIITNLYNPVSGSVIDSWTTNYSGYILNSDGYLTYGVTSGEQQQGIASFFGKTSFGYQCQ